MIKFNDDFYFGSSISATQSEGSFKNPSTWHKLYEEESYKFFGNVGPDDTTDMYHRYKEDIQLLRKTGHNAYRTSISWARLINQDGSVNEEAYKFYRDYFSLIKAQGINLMVNLYHFDTPLHLEEKYEGFVSKKVVEEYRKYAKISFELFNDLVDIWFTFNEPIVSVECGYLKQYHYPMIVDSKKAVQVAFNIALSSSLAIKELKKIDKNKKIGIILNLTPAYPRSNNHYDVKAAKIADLFFSKSFLDPSVKGYYDKELIEIIKKHNLLPEYTNDELEIISNNTVNILGVNYYQPLRVKARENLPNENAPFMPEYYYDYYVMPGRRINPHRGWEIYPKGLYDISINIKENYNNIEWIVMENGMGVENEERFIENNMVMDDYRIDFMKEHLTYLHKGISEGSNCKGYLVWTFIDCWSWLNAFKNRYGLVRLDFNTKERHIKKSGLWFKELEKNKGF